MCPDVPSSFTYAKTVTPAETFSTFDSSTKVLNWFLSTSTDVGVYSYKVSATLPDSQVLYMNIPVNIIL
jgi:hypothetical protein